MKPSRSKRKKLAQKVRNQQAALKLLNGEKTALTESVQSLQKSSEYRERRVREVENAVRRITDMIRAIQPDSPMLGEDCERSIPMHHDYIMPPRKPMSVFDVAEELSRDPVNPIKLDKLMFWMEEARGVWDHMVRVRVSLRGEKDIQAAWAYSRDMVEMMKRNKRYFCEDVGRKIAQSMFEELSK